MWSAAQDIEDGADASGKLGCWPVAPIVKKDDVRLNIEHVMVNGSDAQAVSAKAAQELKRRGAS
jgi:hypothetical protein